MIFSNMLMSFSSVMSVISSVLLAVVILLFMITVHEFGHYITGKIFKFKINEFAIGFGPALFKKKKKNGEFFSIRLLPLGGYCAFEGEDEENPDPNAFNNKPPWQRIIVLISGAFMNFLTALVILIISFAVYGQLLLMTYKVAPVDVNAAEYYSGFVFEDKDIIKKVEGKSVYLTSDLMKALKGGKKGDIYDFTVYREGKQTDIKVKLRSDAKLESIEDTSEMFEALGIAKEGERYEIYSVKWKYGFFETIGRAITYAFKIAGTIFTVLGQLLTGHLSLSAMGGPITTITVTSQIASRGLLQLFEITAYIGVNLAVFNLLPIPALDGSKVVFTSIEWARGKPVNRKVEGAIHFAGFILLLGFAVLVDVLQLF